MPSIRDLINKKNSANAEVKKEQNGESPIFEHKTDKGIPQREDTEFASIGLDRYVIEKLNGVINFDPKIEVNQICTINGIGSDYATNINLGQKVVHVIERATNKHLTDIPLVQMYGELLNADPELDYKNYDDKQQKDYEAKYVAPTVEVIKEATKPSSFANLFGKKPVETKEEEKPYQASIEDLPSNMQPQAQVSTDEGEADPMPTQTSKRGRKPKSVVDAPQKETSEPVKASTPNILQDIANNSNSVIEQLKTLGNAIPSAKLPTSTNVENDGVVEVKDISFDKFRCSTQFIEAISIIVTELTRYINQAKQKE